MSGLRERRVLVALDPGAPQETALQAVASVVQGAVVAEVLGLYVEDVALLDLARLSVVREITHEAAQRSLSAEQVERQFRAQASRLRALFETAASRAGFPHRFQVARGEVHREILKAAAGCDVLVIGHTRAQAMQALAARLCVEELPLQGPQVLVFVQERWPTGRRVAVLYRGPQDETALRLAVNLARTEGLGLAVLKTGTDVPHGALRSVPDEVASSLEVRSRVVPRAGVAELARATAIENARVLVLPGAIIDATPGLIPELLKRVECSVIAIRTDEAP